jgi:hypothetical protein
MPHPCVCICCIQLFTSTTDPSSRLCETCHSEQTRRCSQEETISAPCEACQQKAYPRMFVLSEQMQAYAWLCIPCWLTQFERRFDQLMLRLSACHE